MGFLMPAALGLGALGSFLNGRSQANQQSSQANLYNDWLKNYQNTGQSLYGQAQAAGWNPYGPQTSTHQSNGMSSSQGQSSYSNRPVITGEYQGIDNLMRGIMTGRLSGGSSLPAGYAENAIRGINESFEGADQAARNMAARRGLSGEQSYAVASPANRARAGKIADLRGSLPLLEREMQNQDIGIASGLQSAFGRGEAGQSRTSQSGTTSSMGSNTNPFSAGDLSQIMNVLMPPGPQQTTQTGFSPLGSGISSLGSLMGFLAANQGSKPPMMSGQ
jgi:hypothetical protein